MLKCLSVVHMANSLDVSPLSLKCAPITMIFPRSINGFTRHPSQNPGNDSWFIPDRSAGVPCICPHLSISSAPTLAQTSAMDPDCCPAPQASTHGPLEVGLSVTAGDTTVKIGSCSVSAHHPQSLSRERRIKSRLPPRACVLYPPHPVSPAVTSPGRTSLTTQSKVGCHGILSLSTLLILP